MDRTQAERKSAHYWGAWTGWSRRDGRLHYPNAARAQETAQRATRWPGCTAERTGDICRSGGEPWTRYCFHSSEPKTEPSRKIKRLSTEVNVYQLLQKIGLLVRRHWKRNDEAWRTRVTTTPRCILLGGHQRRVVFLGIERSSYSDRIYKTAND